MRLEAKTALITGASRGIGREIALFFAREGANIALVYAGNHEAAQKTVLEIEAFGQKAIAYPCDVRDFIATKALCDQVISDFGAVDILVNNAGIVRDGLVLSMKEADFDDVLDTNLKGAFNLSKHLYSHMMRRKSGRIINISSVVGLMGNAGQANYAAAKAGLFGLTKSLAKELASRGITVNAIAPGFIESDMTSTLKDEVKQSYLQAIPAKRFGAGAEVASLALFLASSESAYITGEVISINGGLYM